jgi:hypothetical protein
VCMRRVVPAGSSIQITIQCVGMKHAHRWTRFRPTYLVTRKNITSKQETLLSQITKHTTPSYSAQSINMAHSATTHASIDPRCCIVEGIPVQSEYERPTHPRATSTARRLRPRRGTCDPSWDAVPDGFCCRRGRWCASEWQYERRKHIYDKKGPQKEPLSVFLSLEYVTCIA